MIAKITGGASFGGALAYLMKIKEPRQEEKKEQYQEKLKAALRTPGEPAPAFEAGERHRVIGGNLSGETRAEMREEFRAISRQRPDIEKPVHHASLSAGEKDRLTVEQWNDIADRYIREMGFQNCPYAVIQHRDGNVDHIHILASRVDTQGKVASVWQSKERAQEVMRGIERDYGLEQVKSSHEVERAAPKRGEIETFNRTGRLSAKMELQGHVEVALKGSPTATEFIERLQAVGVETIPFIKDERARGVSFRKGKQVMKGSDLGRGFSWNALQTRGLDYNQERDQSAIEAARQRADVMRTKAIEAPALNTPSLDAPTINTPAPEHSFTDLAKDASRVAGQYLLDQIDPVKPIQDQVQMYKQIGNTIVEGYSLVKELLNKDSNSLEQLQRAAGLETHGQDALARLHEAAGIEPGQNDHDIFDRLNQTLDRSEALINPEPVLGEQTLEQTLEPTIGAAPVIEQDVAEHAFEFVLEL
jgi:hypothetical protein